VGGAQNTSEKIRKFALLSSSGRAHSPDPTWVLALHHQATKKNVSFSDVVTSSKRIVSSSSFGNWEEKETFFLVRQMGRFSKN